MKSLNRNQLKYIAIIAMLIDHIAMFFIPVSAPVGFIMRVIGRITAPIMCYFIVEGYYYTKSKKDYGLRLLLFAVISQFAYSFSHYNKIFTFDFSMIFTLLLCFLMLLAEENIDNKVLKYIVIGCLFILSFFGDWGIFAPIWVLIFFKYREDKNEKIKGYIIVSVLLVMSNIIFALVNNYKWYSALWQLGVFIAVPLLLLYNGQSGRRNSFNKWFFYIFYPVHLIILGIIKLYII
ncbi:MAG: conjugal transfer protein TraX [Clostridiales bacterium]|nr:conjugal transfer protein TraX [Clostridiales bacterium]